MESLYCRARFRHAPALHPLMLCAACREADLQQLLFTMGCSASSHQHDCLLDVVFGAGCRAYGRAPECKPAVHALKANLTLISPIYHLSCMYFSGCRARGRAADSKPAVHQGKGRQAGAE